MSSATEQTSRHVQLQSAKVREFHIQQEQLPSDLLHRINKLDELVKLERDVRMRQGQAVQVTQTLQGCVCAGPEFCAGCAAMTAGNVPGHIFWDEVELKNHGWMNAHGSHWTRQEPYDELEQLHHGKVNNHGKHKPGGVTAPLPQVPVTDTVSPASAGHVRFNPKTIYSSYEPDPAIDTAASQSNIQINVDDQLQFSAHKVQRRELDLGNSCRLIQWQLVEQRAYLLVTVDSYMFLQRHVDGSAYLTTKFQGNLRRMEVPPLPVTPFSETSSKLGAELGKM